MLRAGPLSDERVVRLANRRFVSFYFDLADSGAAGDPDARRFVVAQRQELAGQEVAPPPVLLMTAKGEVLGEVGNYATSDEVLRAVIRVLKAHPEYDRSSPAENAATMPLERAEIRMDLQDYQGARAILEKEDSAQAQYLLGRLARFQRHWKKMEAHFQHVHVDDRDLAADVRMERAYRFWFNEEYDKLREHLKDFPKSSKRYTEARYYEGLALYHLGKKDEALAVWKETVEGSSQDPWIYRADWAYTSILDGKKKTFSTLDKGSSLLNRIGYAFTENPDLSGPKN